MSLQKSVMVKMKEAMKTKDAVALESLRAIKSEILLAQTKSGASDGLSDEDEIKLLQKLVKQRQDSLDIYEKQGREDLAIVEREEIEVLKNYLPKAMSEDELRTYLTNLIQELGASGMQDMGKVMGAANAQLAGKADGRTISGLVRELLT